jgi:hypothetical protein
VKRRDPNAYESSLEMEHGSSSVEYVVTYRVTPYEPERGPSYDCGGTPASGGDVEDVEVWIETVKRCAKHRAIAKLGPCRDCTTTRERRPELDDLVDEDELLEHASATADGFDDEHDRRADR